MLKAYLTKIIQLNREWNTKVSMMHPLEKTTLVFHLHEIAYKYREMIALIILEIVR